jgi:hypothetical protein
LYDNPSYILGVVGFDGRFMREYFPRSAIDCDCSREEFGQMSLRRTFGPGRGSRVAGQSDVVSMLKTIIFITDTIVEKTHHHSNNSYLSTSHVLGTSTGACFSDQKMQEKTT